MRTIAQKRRRAKIIKAWCFIIFGIVVFTPKFDLPEMPLPFVTQAFADTPSIGTAP